MNVSATVTDTKRHISENVRLEEWVSGRDTFLLISPSGIPSLTISMIGGEMILRSIDIDGKATEILLKRPSIGD